MGGAGRKGDEEGLESVGRRGGEARARVMEGQVHFMSAGGFVSQER